MYHLTSHLRLNAVYWGLTAVTIMKHPDALDRTDLIGFVMKCWDEKTGAHSTSYNKHLGSHVVARPPDSDWVLLQEPSGRTPVTTRTFSQH
jgi:geranylgeranyl transferase type-2 subunit beta